ncbi:MAG TPA: Uma2 family endonuclease [Beijerinckiaceae bacterium]|nr:Uma2 family endonuclease [Beijerinckiaceae bacterium]
MGVPIRNPEPMTGEEFFAFTETRPDEERWELIDGEPILNASPHHLHQQIVRNLIVAFAYVEKAQKVEWRLIPGIAVATSKIDAPVPDLLIRPARPLDSWICSDALVIFEILSPSTADRDLRWKRKAYASLPSLQHYVVIAQDSAEIAVYDRSSGFAERRIASLAGSLDLATLGVSVPLSEIYAGTGLKDG